MNDVDIKLVGDEELLRAFRELDYRTQHGRLKQVISNAANIYVKAARQVIPIRTTKVAPPSSGARRRAREMGVQTKWHPPGLGKRSIMKKVGKSKKSATYFVGPRTGTNDYRTDAFYLKFWELGTRKKTPANRIIPAYEQNTKNVENDMYNSMRVIIERAWNKHRK